VVIAVAAGKGGTGKTLISAGLAQALALAGEQPVTLVDCDVEEPNADLVLHPTIESHEEVHVLVPEVDIETCTGCGACARHCEFSAIAVLRGKVMTFPELCAGCGVCAYVCPVGAIREVPRKVGTVALGRAAVSLDGRQGTVRFVQGRTEVGEQRSPPVIKAAKAHCDTEGLTILDSSPGTSCPMQETVEGVDYCLLVTEPTPFGLHDLAMAVDTCRRMGVPAGVVINRDGLGDSGPVVDYCRREGVPVLWRLAHSRAIAEAYARGSGLVEALPETAEELAGLVERMRDEVAESGPAAEYPSERKPPAPGRVEASDPDQDAPARRPGRN